MASWIDRKELTSKKLKRLGKRHKEDISDSTSNVLWAEVQDPLSHFQLGEKLGEGTFGAVWQIVPKPGAQINFRNIQGGITRCYATKHIKLEQTTAASEELQTEINFLKAYRNPHIAPYLGVFRQHGLLWIIMEFFELGSILDLMERANIIHLSEKATSWVARSVLLGLQYLHASNMIHRDVKASNILVSGQGSIRLADFGLSPHLTEFALGEVATSPLWMAPEVAQGMPFSPKSDLWSLGITIIELIDGEPPYANLSVFQALDKLVCSLPPTVQLSVASLEFREFLSLLLVQDPRHRADINTLLAHNFVLSSTITKFKKIVMDAIPNPSKKKPKKDWQFTLIPISQAVSAFGKDETPIIDYELEKLHSQSPAYGFWEEWDDEHPLFAAVTEDSEVKIASILAENEALKEANKKLNEQLLKAQTDLQFLQMELKLVRSDLSRYRKTSSKNEMKMLLRQLKESENNSSDDDPQRGSSQDSSPQSLRDIFQHSATSSESNDDMPPQPNPESPEQKSSPRDSDFKILTVHESRRLSDSDRGRGNKDPKMRISVSPARKLEVPRETAQDVRKDFSERYEKRMRKEAEGKSDTKSSPRSDLIGLSPKTSPKNEERRKSEKRNSSRRPHHILTIEPTQPSTDSGLLRSQSKPSLSAVDEDSQPSSSPSESEVTTKPRAVTPPIGKK